MKELTQALLTLLMLAHFVGCAAQYEGYKVNKSIKVSCWLEKYVDKDLSKLKGQNLKLFKKGIGRDLEKDPYGMFDSIYVWKPNYINKCKYIVFEGDKIRIIPGNSSAKIHIFDSAGNKTSTFTFSTGWRIDISKASFSYSKELKSYIITIHTFPAINGQDVGKQYFALSNDELRFIRVEDSKGNIIRNNYTYPNHTLGLPVDAKEEIKWIAMLKSDILVETLTALEFLGGKHMNPEKPIKNVSHESIEQSKLFKSLHGNEIIKKLVKQHQKSNNQWVREAAELAARASYGGLTLKKRSFEQKNHRDSLHSPDIPGRYLKK